MSTKKPVVVESYDEIVFTEPSEGFLARVQDHRAVIMPRLPAGFSLPPPGILIFLLLSHLQISRHVNYMLANIVDRFHLFQVPIEDVDKRKRSDPKDNPLIHWFTNFSEADELLKLAAARQEVSIKKKASLND